MPLDRKTITAASRIMLPAYVVLFTAIGINYLIHPDRLDDSPPLSYADNVLPLPVWGVVFLLCAALMAAALLRGDWDLYRYALLVAMTALGVWTGVFFVAAFASNASVTEFLWPGFAAVACYASFRALGAGETQ